MNEDRNKNPYARNPFALGTFFAALTILWAFTGFAALEGFPPDFQPIGALLIVFYVGFAVLFAWVAWGCVRRYNAARVAAELIASILVLRFPVVGAILAFLVILPLAQWEPVHDDAHTPPPV